MFERPGPRPEVPAVVLRLARDATPVQVWHNELGGLTYRLEAGDRREFVKWSPHHPELDLSLEADKLRWAGRWVTVPEVLDAGSDDDGQWLHTAGLPGESAVAPWFVDRPAVAAAGLGRGLRLLHEALPVPECPWDWSVPSRIAEARERGSGSEAARLALGEPPPIDRLVVCHGDACAPNTLLGPDGSVTGFVDLGALGVADRWADLAIVTYSLGWNFDGEWAGVLLDAYGIAPDAERIAWYRGLWDAT